MIHTTQVHVESAVDHVLNSLAPLATREVDLDKQVLGHLPPIVGDRSHVIQILTNLVGNGLKFTAKVRGSGVDPA